MAPSDKDGNCGGGGDGDGSPCDRGLVPILLLDENKDG